MEGIKVFVETRYDIISWGGIAPTPDFNKAMGFKGETLLTVLSKPKFSQNILRSDLHWILISTEKVNPQFTDDDSDAEELES